LALLINGSAPLSLPYLGPNSDGGSATLQGFYFWDKDGFSMKTPLSLEAWVWQAGVIGTSQYVVYAGGGTFLGGLFVNATGHAVVQAPVTGAAFNQVATLTRQAWHHLVASISSAAVATLYVDGTSLGTANGTTQTATTQPIAVGGAAPAFQNQWQGAVSEVAYYDYALNGTQVSAHFAAADTSTLRPIYKASGTWSVTLGSSTLSAADIALILASVRKAY
jgi:hypothetical protein